MLLREIFLDYFNQGRFFLTKSLEEDYTGGSTGLFLITQKGRCLVVRNYTPKTALLREWERKGFRVLLLLEGDILLRGIMSRHPKTGQWMITNEEHDGKAHSFFPGDIKRRWKLPPLPPVIEFKEDDSSVVFREYRATDTPISSVVHESMTNDNGRLIKPPRQSPQGLYASASVRAQFISAAKRIEWIEIELRDRLVLQGAVVWNSIRETGTIINAVAETRHDFDIDTLMAVRRVDDPLIVDPD